MQPLPPVLVVDRFPAERDALLKLLSGLSPAQWTLPTACAGWSVHDVALHIWGGDIGILSRRRDGWRNPNVSAAGDLSQWEQLVSFINRSNEAWVQATRRISPPILIELLRASGREIAAWFANLDPYATGVSVDWAGPAPAPVWLDTAREYTERWVHQQHIRDAVGQPGLTEPSFLAPVLAAFIRALPRALHEVAAPDGTVLRVVITGDAGGAWDAVRQDGTWLLTSDAAASPNATVTLDQDTAWRLWTRGLSAAQALPRIQREGDAALSGAVLSMVSIIA
jgi:uncharacterized protein (TIGR03083 family)